MKTIDQIKADRRDDLIGVTGGQAAQIKHYYDAALYAIANYSEQKMRDELEKLRVKKRNYDSARLSIIEQGLNEKDRNSRINELKKHYNLTGIQTQIKMLEYVLKD